MRSSSLLLGYHGCSRRIGEAILGGNSFKPSQNNYDWLGHGIYFWENDPQRTFEWANTHPKSKDDPFLIGCIIDLGNCLDLTLREGQQEVESSFQAIKLIYQKSGKKLPENHSVKHTLTQDKVARELDCLVLNTLTNIRTVLKQPPYQTVRGLFPEGEELYPDAGFKARTHTQLCVRDERNIIGTFRVREHAVSSKIWKIIKPR